MSTLRREIDELKDQLRTPAEAPVQTPIQASVRKPKAIRSSKRVLLLDNAELNRVLVSHYFRGLPVQIDYAKTPDQALGSIEGATYDLVLVDFELKVEGEWLSWIKGQYRHTRLFALSPNAFSSEEESKALALGFDSYLSRCEPKPTLVEKLVSSLWTD
jgi:CheY-like chemotaxis protein